MAKPDSIKGKKVQGEHGPEWTDDDIGTESEWFQSLFRDVQPQKSLTPEEIVTMKKIMDTFGVEPRMAEYRIVAHYLKTFGPNFANNTSLPYLSKVENEIIKGGGKLGIPKIPEYKIKRKRGQRDPHFPSVTQVAVNDLKSAYYAINVGYPQQIATYLRLIPDLICGLAECRENLRSAVNGVPGLRESLYAAYEEENYLKQQRHDTRMEKQRERRDSNKSERNKSKLEKTKASVAILMKELEDMKANGQLSADFDINEGLGDLIKMMADKSKKESSPQIDVVKP